MTKAELKLFLDESVDKYNTRDFIQDDPVKIPHRYIRKQDVEIAGFVAATLAWGNRKMIIKNASKLLRIMGESPYDYVMSFDESRIHDFDGFVHRTFNAHDAEQFMWSFKGLYTRFQSMEDVFLKFGEKDTLQPAISQFKTVFFDEAKFERSKKHVSDPLKGSAAKRINMFLRWMVREDNRGVDLGIWNRISPAVLSCPLDVHSGNVARKLGILNRKQNDAKALAELDKALRRFDATDPVKYDFALFGIGVNGLLDDL